MTTTHTQGCLAPCWWRGPVSSPTPRPVPVRRTEGFRHIAVEGGESPNQCGVETPGLRTLGLLCPAAQPPHQPTTQACPTHIHRVPTQLQPCKFRAAWPSQVDIQEQTASWTQTCGPTTCNKAAGGCPHSPARPSTYGPTACKEAAGGCPHREAQYIRTNNLQGTLKRDIQTNSLQRSRVWLPTRPQVLKFAIGAGNSQRTCSAIS